MGYYSEVKIAMKKEDYEELEIRFKTKNYDILNCQDELIERNIDNIVIICWDWVQWGKDNKEIKIVIDYLDELKETGKPYQIIRLGERYDDIEEYVSYGETGADCSCEVLSIAHEIRID